MGSYTECTQLFYYRAKNRHFHKYIQLRITSLPATMPVSKKPTGQGTGLGLSLGYDIIIAHGGEIRVDSKEGEFCEFVIQIPAG
jgi:light-regulated signal transduction histidine kinase (bacteriophytochrome)